MALGVLNEAAYRSRTHPVDTVEVRLALAVLWSILRDRRGLEAFWERAPLGDAKRTDNCRPAWYRIMQACREEGWHAPVDVPHEI